MKLRFTDRLDQDQIEDLHRLFQSEWWTEGRSLADVRTAIEHSNEVFAWLEPEDSRLVAFARVLTDRVFKAIIFDFIVAKSHRSTGLGRVLMQAIVDCPRLAQVSHFELYCLPDLVPFYRRFGFEADIGGLRLMRLARDRAR